MYSVFESQGRSFSFLWEVYSEGSFMHDVPIFTQLYFIDNLNNWEKLFMLLG